MNMAETLELTRQEEQDEAVRKEEQLSSEFFTHALAGDLTITIHGNTRYTFAPHERKPEPLYRTMAELLFYDDLGLVAMKALADAAKRGDEQAIAAVQAMALKYAEVAA